MANPRSRFLANVPLTICFVSMTLTNSDKVCDLSQKFSCFTEEKMRKRKRKRRKRQKKTEKETKKRDITHIIALF